MDADQSTQTADEIEQAIAASEDTEERTVEEEERIISTRNTEREATEDEIEEEETQAEQETSRRVSFAENPTQTQTREELQPSDNSQFASSLRELSQRQARQIDELAELLQEHDDRWKDLEELRQRLERTAPFSGIKRGSSEIYAQCATAGQQQQHQQRQPGTCRQQLTSRFVAAAETAEGGETAVGKSGADAEGEFSDVGEARAGGPEGWLEAIEDFGEPERGVADFASEMLRAGGGIASGAGAAPDSGTSHRGAGAAVAGAAGEAGRLGAGKSDAAGAEGGRPGTSGASASHGVGAASRPIVKPQWPVFKKGTNIAVFNWLFEQQASAAVYPKNMWVSTYCNLLEGRHQHKASIYVKQHPKCTFEDLIAHMEDPKSGTQSDQSAQIRFKTRKPKRGEDASEFSEVLSNLGYTAYAGDDRDGESWSAAQIDKLVLDCFLDNLGGDLGAKVNEFFPKTMNEAVRIARNFETKGLTPGYDDLGLTVSYVHHGRGGGAARGGVRGGRGGGANWRGDGNRRVSSTLWRPPTANYIRPTANMEQEKETRTCHHCGRVGHLIKDCFKKKKEEKHGSKAGGKERKPYFKDGRKGRESQNERSTPSST